MSTILVTLIVRIIYEFGVLKFWVILAITNRYIKLKYEIITFFTFCLTFWKYSLIKIPTVVFFFVIEKNMLFYNVHGCFANFYFEGTIFCKRHQKKPKPEEKYFIKITFISIHFTFGVILEKNMVKTAIRSK